MKGPKKGKGIDLKAAVDNAAEQIDSDALGEYKVEFTVIVANPKIREYIVTLVPIS
jgi:hypothetical protein